MLINFYKIVCPGDEVYIGSTKRSIDRRWIEHKSAFKANTQMANSKILFDKYGVENCKIELIETRECDTKTRYKVEAELTHTIQNCVNRLMIGSKEKHKKFRESHKEQRLEYNKAWKDQNKERIKIYNKAYQEKQKAIRQFEKAQV